MNAERLKLIVKNMDLLVQSLKEELNDFPEVSYQNIVPYLDDVDEYYTEDEEDV
jgi:hypothetical protein